jgi:hypothetical protein
MSIRIIRDNEPLDSIWDELVFTEARLLGDEQAKTFAPTITDLLTRLDQVSGGQLGLRRESVTAQAQVDALAATSRTDHRVRSITTLIDDINGARLSLFGTLLQKATELHLLSDWPYRFFRRISHSPKVQPAAATAGSAAAAGSAAVAGPAAAAGPAAGTDWRGKPGDFGLEQHSRLE